MVTTALTLTEIKHPDQDAEISYHQLIGIDEQKTELLKNLTFLLDSKRIDKWAQKHHNEGISLLLHLDTGTPLVILSGEVGCGKTALAQTIGTPLALSLGRPVKVFETPSNIRGSGMVGEISNRITEAFEFVKSQLRHEEVGLLIIDEADDIATSRSQNQAHHEDRAGLNVLIKQLDGIKRSKKSIVVIMITNRVTVLDPAIRRRTSLHLVFERPTGNKLIEVLRWLLLGTTYTEDDFKKLVDVATNRIPFSFSDLIHRAGKQAIFSAIERDVQFDIHILTEVLSKLTPTPLLDQLNK
ncbi:AAA family ATPase (plasmid) [Spirosoma sp. SC4-14]|uniref:AAA family ATPase n=1 Tax=Spirosoma sp. SC4-14 TaxID=3128900 RepID=UPI0030D5D41B